MIVAEAKIIIYKSSYIVGNNLDSGFRCTLNIENEGYICKLSPINKDKIYLDEDCLVEMFILNGELSIDSFVIGKDFKFISGKEIGKGKIISVKKIFVEKESFRYIKDVNKIKTIVKKAENLDNAEIAQDVYELL